MGVETLQGFIWANISEDIEAIYTDEWGAHKGIADQDTEHKTVNHGEGEYVKGDVHTNSVENVWSLLKRCIIGSYHQVRQSTWTNWSSGSTTARTPTCSAMRC
jgi:hypothetical protein